MTITSSVDFGAAQTGVGYQPFGASGSLGSVITNVTNPGSITNPNDGVYVASAVNAPSGTLFVQWTCDDAELTCNDGDLMLRNGDAFKSDIQSVTGTAVTNIDDFRSLTASERTSVATAVWASATRTLSSFGTLAADVWSAATRTLTAFGFTVATSANSTETAIKAKTDLLTFTGTDVHALVAGSAGSGAFVVTVTVTDGVDPLENALVRLTEGVNTFTTLTNVSGVATFALDAATYTISITKTGYSFTPTTIAVSAAANFNKAMTVVVVPAPANPDLSTAYLTTLRLNGEIWPSAEVSFRMISASEDSTGYWDMQKFLSNSLGSLQVPLVRNADYEARIGEGEWIAFTVTDTDTFPIPNLYGNP